jgi:hypothetical protein
MDCCGSARLHLGWDARRKPAIPGDITKICNNARNIRNKDVYAEKDLFGIAFVVFLQRITPCHSAITFAKRC